MSAELRFLGSTMWHKMCLVEQKYSSEIMSNMFGDEVPEYKSRFIWFYILPDIDLGVQLDLEDERVALPRSGRNDHRDCKHCKALSVTILNSVIEFQDILNQVEIKEHTLQGHITYTYTNTCHIGDGRVETVTLSRVLYQSNSSFFFHFDIRAVYISRFIFRGNECMEFRQSPLHRKIWYLGQYT